METDGGVHRRAPDVLHPAHEGVAKLIYGVSSDAISRVADGIHSVMDSSSNVVGLLGTAIAARPISGILMVIESSR